MVKHLILIVLGVMAFSAARADSFILDMGYHNDCRYSNSRSCQDYNRRLPQNYGYYTCYAEDTRGRQFRGRAYDRYSAEREAMNRCYRNSYYCRFLGCRYR